VDKQTAIAYCINTLKHHGVDVLGMAEQCVESLDDQLQHTPEWDQLSVQSRYYAFDAQLDELVNVTPMLAHESIALRHAVEVLEQQGIEVTTYLENLVGMCWDVVENCFYGDDSPSYVGLGNDANQALIGINQALNGSSRLENA
jgi:hypothetical protein